MNCRPVCFLIFAILRAVVLAGVASAWLSAGMAAAQMPVSNEWLTMTGFVGEPFDSNQNVVQVNPQSIRETAAGRTMQIRVSRALNRLSWDGVPYRSYVATVEFDCDQKTARYQVLNYYLEPGWHGGVSQISAYPAGQYRSMALREIYPNPTERIIRAACTTHSVISN